MKHFFTRIVGNNCRVRHIARLMLDQGCLGLAALLLSQSRHVEVSASFWTEDDIPMVLDSSWRGLMMTFGYSSFESNWRDFTVK